jgi:polyhydroxyalkanoate synthesis regulator phasin
MTDEANPEQRDEAGGGPAAAPVGASARDTVERTLLLALGAAALTKDRIQAVVEDFVRRGQLSSDEGKDLVEKLGARSRDEAKAAFKRLDGSLQGTYHDMGLATRRELEDLDFRVRQLEHRLSLAERQLDAASGVPQDL